MRSNPNRVMIAGTGSGSGKTTVTCALISALAQRGMKISSFKCGPDYIDPMFHSKILGVKSSNIDLYMCGENTVKRLFADNSADCDIAVVEGVMGMYDGLGFDNDMYSSNHVSAALDIPEILVVDVKGMSLSVSAQIFGYINFKKNNLKGVILNNCSEMMYPHYKKSIENQLDISVYGFMPQIDAAKIGSRHLGLITAAEISDIKEKLSLLGKSAEKYIDLDGIISLAEKCAPIEYEHAKILKAVSGKVRIAAAYDNAFCFYYNDNFRLLEMLGAEIVFFSPIKDKKLPSDIDGLFLGGGYPEEYKFELSRNTDMLRSIRQAVKDGIPTFAECGGFMYLGKSIDGVPMAGVIDSDFKMTDKTVRFGYLKVTANMDNMLCRKGESIHCHEFHYSDGTYCGDSFTAEKRNRSWKCIIADKNLFCGYPHFHFWGNIGFAENFVARCGEYRKEYQKDVY